MLRKEEKYEKKAQGARELRIRLWSCGSLCLPFGGFMLLWTVDGRNKGISNRWFVVAAQFSQVFDRLQWGLFREYN